MTTFPRWTSLTAVSLSQAHPKSFGTGNPATPNNNIVFAKFNSSWAPVFQKVLGGARDETGYFKETNDGGFLFLGESNSYGTSASDDDLLLFKITSAGGLTWKKAYHYSLTDSISDVVELSDGYLVSRLCCGQTEHRPESYQRHPSYEA